MEECLHCCLTACRFEIDLGPNMFMGKAFKTWHLAVPRTRSEAAPQAWLFIGAGGKRVKEQFQFPCKVGMGYLATQISDVYILWITYWQTDLTEQIKKIRKKAQDNKTQILGKAQITMKIPLWFWCWGLQGQSYFEGVKGLMFWGL